MFRLRDRKEPKLHTPGVGYARLDESLIRELAGRVAGVTAAAGAVELSAADARLVNRDLADSAARAAVQVAHHARLTAESADKARTAAREARRAATEAQNGAELVRAAWRAANDLSGVLSRASASARRAAELAGEVASPAQETAQALLQVQRTVLQLARTLTDANQRLTDGARVAADAAEEAGSVGSLLGQALAMSESLPIDSIVESAEDQADVILQIGSSARALAADVHELKRLLDALSAEGTTAAMP